jgi:cytochrome c oxidase subunit II
MSFMLAASNLALVRFVNLPPRSPLAPAGPAADRIAHLNWFILILFLIITVVMWALIALVASRPRGRFEEHAPYDAGGGHSWVLIGGFAIPAVILFIIFVMGLDSMSAFPIHDGHETAPEIRITGHQWWWEVEYLSGGVNEHFITANEIHIPAGRTIDIDLVSADVIHSFWVPALHGKVDLVPGQINRIRVEASQPGTYTGTCAEYCGRQHVHMELLVVADAPQDYERWMQNQRAEATAPLDAQEQHGERVFQSKPCGFCHTIRGTLAGGRVGPDLTHFGSRRELAANMLPNDDANLMAWVTHAQSLKDGSMMPNLTQFNGDDLQAVVAYLRHLK